MCVREKRGEAMHSISNASTEEQCVCVCVFVPRFTDTATAAVAIAVYRIRRDLRLAREERVCCAATVAAAKTILGLGSFYI